MQARPGTDYGPHGDLRSRPTITTAAAHLPHLRCCGLGARACVGWHRRGRKGRITPLAPGTAATLKAWLGARLAPAEGPAVVPRGNGSPSAAAPPGHPRRCEPPVRGA
jgi:hypothetical protein